MVIQGFPVDQGSVDSRVLAATLPAGIQDSVGNLGTADFRGKVDTQGSVEDLGFRVTAGSLGLLGNLGLAGFPEQDCPVSPALGLAGTLGTAVKVVILGTRVFRRQVQEPVDTPDFVDYRVIQDLAQLHLERLDTQGSVEREPVG